MATSAIQHSPEFLTVNEAAALLRVSTGTIRRHADELGAVRVGKQLRVPTPINAPTMVHSPRRPLSANKVNGRPRLGAA